jgi:hypothetical protein
VRRLIAAVTIRRWLPTILWAIVILGVSSLPDLDIAAEKFRGCDKVLHFIEYSILGMALRYWSRRRRIGFPFGGMGFAALDELHQRLIPGREASLWDFMADVGGVLLGFFLIGWKVGGKEKHG